MAILVNKKIKNKGFTLIELLVVITILGIIAVVGLMSFQSSMKKARDAKRKSDLEQLQRVLEMYNNDTKSYPLSSSGMIVIDGTAFDWTTEPEIVDSKGTVYLKKLPKDPSTGVVYCYSSDGISYAIYAILENLQDLKIAGPFTCNGINTYNYGVSSSDISP